MLGHMESGALIVPVLEAAPAVDPHRSRLDPSSGLGVPAHVTVLFPFTPPESLDDASLVRLAAAVRSVPPFRVRFSATSWFGDDVLWLKPDDDGGFRALTRSVREVFPAALPYEGLHYDAVPHLTIGMAPLACYKQLREAESAVHTDLPIETTVRIVEYGVVSDSPGSWTVHHRLHLG